MMRFLYFSRAAVRQDFTGSIIEYGSWPPQPTKYFSHDAVKLKLADYYQTSIELAVRQGIVELLKRLGVDESLPLGCGLVDAVTNLILHWMRYESPRLTTFTPARVLESDQQRETNG